MPQARFVPLVRGVCALGLLGAALLLAAPASARPEVKWAGAAEITVHRDYSYVSGTDYTLYADVFIPAGSGPFPAVLAVHGGGWRNGDKSWWEDEGYRLAEEGFVAMVVDYRLAPPGGEWHYPAPVQDLRAAMRWLRTYADQFSVDPERVGAMGGSAGGNLVLMLGTTGYPGSDKADAVVSWSGPANLNLIPPSRMRYDFSLITNYIGCPRFQCPEIWDDASPELHASPGDAPTYLANSTHEINPPEQALHMADALTKASVPNYVHLEPGTRHSVGLEEYVWDESVSWLRTYLAP